MENIWIVIISIAIFSLFVFLFWRVTSGKAKKEYGTKMWKHWPTRLSYWQAAILYSTGFTIATLFLLKWVNVLPV